MEDSTIAKRFTDTAKWRKHWFYNLSLEGKLLWLYVCDQCDHIGICEFNDKLYSSDLGFKITKIKFEGLLSKQIHWITDYRFFVKDFIDFQYGELNPNNRLHKSVLEGLNKHNIDLSKIKNQEYQAPLMGLVSPSEGAKDKDKDKKKEKDKEQDKEKDKEIGRQTRDFIKNYCDLYKVKHKVYPDCKGPQAAAAKRIIESSGCDNAIAYIPYYLEMKDNWFITKAYDLITFAQNLNKIKIFAETGKLTTKQQAHQNELLQGNLQAMQEALNERK